MASRDVHVKTSRRHLYMYSTSFKIAGHTGRYVPQFCARRIGLSRLAGRWVYEGLLKHRFLYRSELRSGSKVITDQRCSSGPIPSGTWWHQAHGFKFGKELFEERTSRCQRSLGRWRFASVSRRVDFCKRFYRHSKVKRSNKNFAFESDASAVDLYRERRTSQLHICWTQGSQFFPMVRKEIERYMRDTGLQRCKHSVNFEMGKQTLFS